MELENSKSLGGGSQEKISKMAFSSSSNGQISGKNNKKISSLERKKLGSGSTVVVYNNADYLSYMHHPPKHNWWEKKMKIWSLNLVLKVMLNMKHIYIYPIFLYIYISPYNIYVIYEFH